MKSTKRCPKCQSGDIVRVPGKRDIAFANLNQTTERILVRITLELDNLGRTAIGGLPYRVSRSRYYADLYRDAVKSLKIGNIATWWSYEQFAHRGMEPALRFIAAVGDRLDKLRDRVQRVKDDILQSSINYQTEATRDNTHKLERIQKSMKDLTRVTADAALVAEQAGLRADRWKWIYYITAVVFGVVIVAM
ncbi:MAG: DUF3422 family protein [Hyphomicrobiaceae bacterium]